MDSKLLKNLSEDAGLNSLAEYLKRCGRMLSVKLDTVDALNFGLSQEPKAEGRLHEWASVDFGV